MKLRGGITPPQGKGGEPGRKRQLRFTQTNSGQYEAEVKAEEAGSYFLNAQAVRMKKVKGARRQGTRDRGRRGQRSRRRDAAVLAGVCRVGKQHAVAGTLARTDGGQRYEEDEILLDEAAKAGTVFRPAPERVKSLLPLWYWLVFLAAVLLVSDVAVRRLAIDPERIAEKRRYVWARLRGLPVPEPRQEIVERLQMRHNPGAIGPAQVRSVQRFESGTIPTSGLPSGADATAAPPPPSPPGATPAAPSLGAAPPEPEAGDYASRLLKAKKKALEERKKDEPK